MKLFGKTAAKHFCGAFDPRQPSVAIEELFVRSLAKRSVPFVESEPLFQSYRSNLLRNSDRNFFLGVSGFRRALDMFTPSAVAWANTSLYYAGFFAAQAILGMHGCWVPGPIRRRRVVVGPVKESPGAQAIAVENAFPSSYTGSHQVFWDVYYKAMTPLATWAKPEHGSAVLPISNNPLWSIERRNKYNYRSFDSFLLMNRCRSGFQANRFPTTLEPDVAGQFDLTKALLLYCADSAQEHGLETDVHEGFKMRGAAIRSLIFNTPTPSLGQHGQERMLAV